MRIKKYTITQADLNTGTEQSTDVTLQEVNLLRPDQMLAINNTGANLGYILLENDTEINNRIDYPSHYDFLPLSSGETYFDIPTPQYIIIKVLSGTASDDLIFYAINHR